MVGTILNGLGILAGGVAGLAMAQRFSPRAQQRLKLLLGAFTVYVGLGMTWTSVSGGSFWAGLKLFGLVVVALMLGRLTGRVLRLQQSLNRLGQFAKERVAAAQAGPGHRFGEGFVTCTVLFCVGPMAILGSLQDGLKGDFKILAIKSVMDGLATMAFVQTFGWGVMLAALPVVAYQGTITLGAQVLRPYLENHALVDPLYAAGGLILFAVALVMLDLKKVALADYLPSLIWAPFLNWLVRWL